MNTRGARVALDSEGGDTTRTRSDDANEGLGSVLGWVQDEMHLSSRACPAGPDSRRHNQRRAPVAAAAARLSRPRLIALGRSHTNQLNIHA